MIAFAAYNKKIADEIKSRLATDDDRAFAPSPQQQALFDWIVNGAGNAAVEAVAGAGKTTTLIQACKLMGGEVKAGTFHSFGFSAWRRAHQNVKVDDRKKRDAILLEIDIDGEVEDFAFKLASLAKQNAVGYLTDPNDRRVWQAIIDHHDLTADLEGSEQEVAKLALIGTRTAYAILREGRKIAHELIDFDDMIYMPLVNNSRVWKHDWVLVDEYQDINPARRALAARMLRDGGRAIFVGDTHQAIYGFAGADSDACATTQEQFDCIQLPLTVTYRCPKTVVAAAQAYVSHIEAHETAPEGDVNEIPLQHFYDCQQFLEPADAVLCRKTAPLMNMAFSLIKANVPCHVEGRDIGAGLLKLVNRWKSVKNIHTLADRLDIYLENEIAKFNAKKRKDLAEQVTDRVDTLRTIMASCKTLDEVRAKISEMFKDNEPTLTLSTIHKSKGREWNRVFYLGQNTYTCQAELPWQKVQETNLVYVAYTRAKQTLTLLEV